MGAKVLLFALFFIQTICKLVYIADVANPGARYPISDIYDGKSYGQLQGQLNPIGMRQRYLLGTYLRADYVDK